MKRLHTLLAGVVILMATACTQEQPGIFSMPDNRLNFQFYDGNGDLVDDAELVTDAMRFYSFSFVFSGMEAVRDTVWFTATTMGPLSKEARPYALRQIQREGVLNAEPGVHYVAFDDPEMQALCQVAPDSCTVQVPVILLRDASLKDTTAVLEFGFAENAYFKPGYDGFTTRYIEFADRLTKPSYWDMYGLGIYYFGDYGEVKHQLLIEWTGHPWDDAYIEEFMYSDYAYQNYICDYVTKRLAEENAEREAAGLGVYEEKDGTLVNFTPSYY